jgi:LPS-assembly protein
MGKFFRFFILLSTAALFLSPSAVAIELGGTVGGAPVSLSADQLTYDQETGIYHAAGGVRLQSGEMSLLAEDIRWQVDTAEAVATGKVRLTDPEGIVEGESLSLNVNTGQGRLHQGKVFIREQNFHLAGEDIEKLGGQSYRVHRGTFTTCDGETPAWKFGARRVDVTLGEYAHARHVIFYIRDIPVFYSPYLVYPVKTERESGFLMPRAGYSQRRGTQVSLAYYQVLARNKDATFYLDYLSRLGVGKGLEYRYILGERDNEGIFQGYYITGLEGSDDRQAFDWKHSGRLPAGIRLTADVEYVSDRAYFEDFGEVAGEYNKDIVQSVVSLSRTWDRYSLAGQLKYTRDLEGPNDQTLQRLPDVFFTARRERIGASPFYYGLDSSYTHFWRREGVTGHRLQARPFLSAAFQPGEILEIVPEAGYRERMYWTSEGNEREGIYDFFTRISTRFSRVFQTPERKTVQRVQHLIEPEVFHLFIPAQDQTHLPHFDALDRIEPANRVGYALTNRLTTATDRGNGRVYREFAYLRLFQEYDIREARRDLLEPGDDRRPFSDIRADLRVLPTERSFLQVDASYDVYARGKPLDRFPLFNALAGVHDGTGNGISVNYRFQRDDLEYIAGNVDLAWLRPVFLNYQHRHGLSEGRLLEQVVNLEYRAQCWSLFLIYRDRLEDKEVWLNFALTGLGQIGRLGANLGQN